MTENFYQLNLQVTEHRLDQFTLIEQSTYDTNAVEQTVTCIPKCKLSRIKVSAQLKSRNLSAYLK